MDNGVVRYVVPYKFVAMLEKSAHSNLRLGSMPQS